MLALCVLVHDLLQAGVIVAIGVPPLRPRGLGAALRWSIGVGDLIQHLRSRFLFPEEGQLPPADFGHGRPRNRRWGFLQKHGGTVKGVSGEKGGALEQPSLAPNHGLFKSPSLREGSLGGSVG